MLTLPSGRHVFGMGDAVAVNDPITGQGSNNATKCSRIYMDAILARGDQAFSPDWMNATFERFWSYAQHVVAWTNSMLLPPPAHLLKALATAAQSPELAHLIANGFDDPRRFVPWWFDAEQCEKLIERTLPLAA